MSTKNPEDQAKKAFPVWFLIALLFTLVWFTGFLWLKQANKEVTETHKTRAVTIPIELQDKSCVLTIPACELELRTPEKISLANRANIDLKICIGIVISKFLKISEFNYSHGLNFRLPKSFPQIRWDRNFRPVMRHLFIGQSFPTNPEKIFKGSFG